MSKSCEIQQEFYFCHPKNKFDINKIYNSHFTGSPLWDLFSRESEMIENSWNVSFRHMYQLPLQTHRRFVESVSGVTHVKTTLIRRFLGFLKQIRTSPKAVTRDFLCILQNDVRSTTGNNLRSILLATDKIRVEDLSVEDANCSKLRYHRIPDDEFWKVGYIQELLDIKHSQLQVEGFEVEEIDAILNHICVE